MAIKETLAVHANYHKSTRNKFSDVVMVKLRHLHDDGTQSTEVKSFRNPKRPIYVTKDKYRYDVKPEYANVRECTKYMTTESNMFNVAKKALKSETDIYKARGMRDVNNSPNIFWSSLTVGSIILQHLRTKENMNSSSILPTVGAVDFEWDVDTGMATIGSYAYENRSVLRINRDHFAKTEYRSEENFIKLYKKGFEDIVKPILSEYYSRKDVVSAGQVIRDFVPEIEFVDNELDLMTSTFALPREDSVDFLTAWNGAADIGKSKEVAEKYAVPLHQIYVGDDIDAEFKNAEFKEGQKGSKLDANGMKKSVKIQDEWHELISTTPYKYIDMMGTYHRNRSHLPDAPSASLDWCLTKELSFGKLKIECGISEDDIVRWHREMSVMHLLEYALYASMDTIDLIVLEDKNFEISSTYFSGVGFSPYSEFVRNPMRLSTDMHFECIKMGLVVCGVGSNMASEIDKCIVPSRNITVTLNPSYNSGMMMPILSDTQDLAHVVSNGADGDLTSSYPSNQILSNGSKGTTSTEYCGLPSLGRLAGNSIGYTLMAGAHNNHTIAQCLLKLPSSGELIKRLNTRNTSND